MAPSQKNQKNHILCRGVKYGFLDCICQDRTDLHFVFYPVDPDRIPFEGGVKLLKKSKNNKRSKKWQRTHQKMKRTKKNNERN